MTPKTYQLLERCISEGLSQGIYQYNKHWDQPIDIPLEMQSNLVHHIMCDISEWFTFTDAELGVIVDE